MLNKFLSFFRKKPEIKSEKTQKIAPKYHVVSKEGSFDCYMSKTYVYLKDGTRYVSISRQDHGKHHVSRKICLVTGNVLRASKELNENNVGTLRTLEQSITVGIYNQTHYHNGIFTSFEDRKGNTISVQSIDVDRIVQKPSFVYKTEILEYDELEEIK